MQKLNAKSHRLAIGLGDIFGDIFTPEFLQGLITALIQNLFKCDPPVDGSAAQLRVKRHYNERRGVYGPVFFARVARSVRQEAAKKGELLTDNQSHSVAQAVLDDIRTGDPSEMSQLIMELRA